MMDVYFCLQKNNIKQDSNIKKQDQSSSMGIGINQKSLQPLQQSSHQPDHKIYFKQLIKLYHVIYKLNIEICINTIVKFIK